MKSSFDQFIAGGTACIMNHGTTKSGKTCTFFGESGSNGVLHRAGEYILNATHSKIFASAFEIIDKQCFDLACGKRNLLKDAEPVKKEMNSKEDFNRFLEHVNKIRTTKATNENLTSSRSHLMFVLSTDNHNSKIAFLDLAGFECPDGKENAESKFINQSLFELNSFLISQKEKTICSSSTNIMVERLKPFLKPGSRSTIMYHVNNTSLKKGLGYIKDIASSSVELKRKNSTTLRDVTNSLKINRAVN